MKRFYKFLAALFLMAGIFTLASCASRSGVKGELKVTTVTKDSIELTAYFDAYDKIESGDAVVFIECYTVADDTETYKTKNTLSFGGKYTSASYTFTSLSVGTEYKFILKVTYNSNDEVISTLNQKTSEKGSSSDAAIEIATKDQLLEIVDDPTAYYVLTADIDFSDADGKATALSTLFSDSKKFSGSFDGANHTISGFTLTTANYMGLFGYVQGTTEKAAEIKNLTVANVSCDVTRTNCQVGAVAGYAENAVFTNVKVGTATDAVTLNLACNTTAKAYVGGVVGRAVNTSFDNVTVENTTLNLTKARLEARVGLLAGQVDGLVDGALVSGTNVSGKIVANAYFTDSSKTVAFVYVGGLIGENNCQSPINNTNVDADILITRDSSTSSVYFDLAVGGFIGYANGSIEVNDSTAKADITVYAGQTPTGETDEAKATAYEALKTKILSERDIYVGGFVGYLNHKIVKISNSSYIVKNEGIKVIGSQCATKDDDDKLKGFVGISSRIGGTTKDIESSFATLTISEEKIETSVDTAAENVSVADSTSFVK